jgi:Zn-dependent protease
MTHVEPSPQRTPPAATGSFPNAWTLFHVEGVPVRLDRSWLLIAAIVAYLFYGRFTVTLPQADTATLAGLAVAGAVLFFASILAHELGHALTSLDRDIPVLGITLFVMGGVTESTQEAQRARDEFVIVGIGPFISLVLAGAFGLVFTAVEGIAPLAALAGYLAWANLALAIFNIVPGYPLDGGRLLRSILWGITGKPHKSTRWAARVGQAFAGLLIALGLAAFVTQRGGGLDGLWEVLIGAFLFRGATASHKRAAMREQLEGRRIADVMGNVPPTLPPQWSLAQALPQMQQRPSLLWPVDDPVRGGVLLEQIDAIPSQQWDRTLVEQIAHAVDRVTVDVEESLDTAVTRMADAPHNMLIVVANGRPVGLLTPSLVTGLHR